MKEKEAEHYFASHPTSEPRYGLIRTHFRRMPFEFLTVSGVFSKERVDLGTRLLIECMILPEKGSVLDIGCGYGPVGISAAVFSPCLSVVMVDVNLRAVRVARRNIELNHVWNAEVRRGHLYEPVKELVFDCIVTNPPVSAGMKTVEAIVRDAPQFMNEGARFQMVVRSKIAGKRLQTFITEAFGNVEVLARQSGYRVFIAEKQ